MVPTARLLECLGGGSPRAIKHPFACSDCLENLLETLGSQYDRNLVDPASSHMLVSKIKPCMSKYKHFIL